MDTATNTNNIRNEVLTRLIEKMKGGVAPWRKSWNSTDPTRLPTNYKTRKPYHGPLNKMVLWDAQRERNFPTGYWATARQWAGAGGEILPGEYPARIVRPVWNMGGKATGFLPVELFNLGQTKGIDVPLPVAPPEFVIGQRTIFDRLVDESGAMVVYGGNEAIYAYDMDLIVVPNPFRFPNYSSFAETLAHEMLHWSEPRLKILDQHPFLELRAEIGASFLMAELGIPDSGDLENHVAYIGHWLDEMADDPTYLQEAAQEAGRGVDYLLSFIQPTDCQKGLCKITN